MRAGEVDEAVVDEAVVDEAVRNVLRLASRVGILQGAEPAVAPKQFPPAIDGDALAREIAARSFVLIRNQNHAIPLDRAKINRLALIGAAARHARVLGGSAQVSPATSSPRSTALPRPCPTTC